MDLRKLKTLIELVETSGIAELEIQEGEERVRAAYGPGKYDRLVAVKDRYVPTNRFRFTHNIKPTKRDL